MRRRRVLQTMGAGCAGTFLAGCLEAPVDGKSPTVTTTATQTEDFAWDPATAVPVTAVRIGTPWSDEEIRPRDVRVWNDSAASIDVALHVSEGDRSRYDERITLPADAFLTVSLLDPGHYDVRIRTRDRETTVQIPREAFDCNQAWTDVQVPADDSLRQRTVSTEIACPPRIHQTAMDLTAMDGSQPGRCGTENEASVSWGNEAITVTGSIKVPNPCHGARLAWTSVDQSDTLTVAIETVDPPEGTACIECVGTVPYRMTVQIRPRLPSTVTVTHDGETTQRAQR